MGQPAHKALPGHRDRAELRGQAGAAGLPEAAGPRGLPELKARSAARAVKVPPVPAGGTDLRGLRVRRDHSAGRGPPGKAGRKAAKEPGA